MVSGNAGRVKKKGIKRQICWREMRERERDITEKL